MTESKISKEDRKLYGVSGKPLVATRVFAKPMSHKFENVNTPTVLKVLNESEGTVTSANVYDGNLGKNFKAECYTHPLPEDLDKQIAKWEAKGFVEIAAKDYQCLAQAKKARSKRGTAVAAG